jgi:hypothetical protein
MIARRGAVAFGDKIEILGGNIRPVTPTDRTAINKKRLKKR